MESPDEDDKTHPSHLSDITNSVGDLEASLRSEPEKPVSSKEETEVETAEGCDKPERLSTSTPSISSDFANLKQDETIISKVLEDPAPTEYVMFII